MVKPHYELLETKQQQKIESLWKTYLFRYQPTAFDYAEHSPGDIVKSTSFAKLIKTVIMKSPYSKMVE